jgi:hypothetical protein
MALIGVVETVSTHSVVSFCLTVADVGLIIITRVSTARHEGCSPDLDPRDLGGRFGTGRGRWCGAAARSGGQ